MTIYGKGCISNYRNCSLCYVWYSVLYRMLTSLIEPVTTTEMNEATPRPLFSPMSTGKAYTDLGYQPSAFEEGLKEW